MSKRQKHDLQQLTATEKHHIDINEPTYEFHVMLEYKQLKIHMSIGCHNPTYL
jgi:hypothetical protein